MPSTSFDPYLEPYLISREPRLARYVAQLAEFHDWVCTEVDAQASYTDRYAPPALQTWDRNGEVVNRVVLNPWYEEQHREVYRRGIVGLPYAEDAPHLLTFVMSYALSQADISLARKVLGYEPRVGFEEGLRRTLQWYREQV